MLETPLVEKVEIDSYHHVSTDQIFSPFYSWSWYNSSLFLLERKQSVRWSKTSYNWSNVKILDSSVHATKPWINERTESNRETHQSWLWFIRFPGVGQTWMLIHKKMHNQHNRAALQHQPEEKQYLIINLPELFYEAFITNVGGETSFWRMYQLFLHY